MRPVRQVSAEEENFRMEPMGGFRVIRRDPVEPEPVGTLVLMAFRITGYDPDCDGSLMARLEQVSSDGTPTGWETNSHGLYPGSEVVVTAEELSQLFGEEAK